MLEGSAGWRVAGEFAVGVCEGDIGELFNRAPEEPPMRKPEPKEPELTMGGDDAELS